jgi:hypothetical protein
MVKRSLVLIKRLVQTRSKPLDRSERRRSRCPRTFRIEYGHSTAMIPYP